jgi:pimeloyl-ACP methyl ester carboxylesterase/DNA-binding CsgD family transcriptional regulator
LRIGDGPPIVFASNIFGDAHLYRVGWPHVRDVTDRLAGLGWSVVRYDVRGMGDSDRQVNDLSLDARVKDLEAVVAEVRLGSFALVGVDAGAATAVAYAVAHPDVVVRLVLVSPWARGAEKFSIPEAHKVNSSVPTGDHEWVLFQKVLAGIVTGFDEHKALRDVLVDGIERSSSPAGLAAYYQASAAIDISHLLSQVTVPTLVVHESAFPFGSFQLCDQVAATVTGAELVVVDGPGIAGYEQHEHVAVLDSFLRTGRAEVPANRDTQPSQGSAAALTPREVTVLGLVASGASNKEIAAALGIAVTTVERHLVNAYAKIGARGRADATVYALRHALAP